MNAHLLGGTKAKTQKSLVNGFKNNEFQTLMKKEESLLMFQFKGKHNDEYKTKTITVHRRLIQLNTTFFRSCCCVYFT